MGKSRFTDSQELVILKKQKAGVPVLELSGEQNVGTVLIFQRHSNLTEWTHRS